MIEFRDVNKLFRKKKETIHALKDISFTIRDREIFGVIGYSGAGKSTLVRLVNQLERATSGSVIVNDHKLDTYDEKALRKVRKDIGMIFQHFNLLNSKTVFMNVAMPLRLSHLSKDEIHQKVNEMLEFVGLADKKQQYPNELSGGQKQRVAIARALVTQPKILLCDEATSALDPATTDSILKLLKDVNESMGITVMMITHEMSVIQQICDRVAVMEDGSVVELGDVKQVFSHPQTATAKNFVSTVINAEPTEALKAEFKSVSSEQVVDYRLFLDTAQISQPLVHALSHQHGLDMNILFSSMSTIQEETVCYLWLRFTKDHHLAAFDLEGYFKEKGIQFEEVYDLCGDPV